MWVCVSIDNGEIAMAVISLITGKGGAGKTTTAIGIFAELARRGHKVVGIDDDPSKTFRKWMEMAGLENATIFVRRPDKSIKDDIREATKKAEFVIVDTEGVMTKGLALAAMASDVVVMPMQLSEQDMAVTIETFTGLKAFTDEMSKPPAMALVMTRTTKAMTKHGDHIFKEVEQAGLPVLEGRMTDRVAWREMMNHGSPPVGKQSNQGANAAAQDIAKIVDQVLELVERHGTQKERAA